MKRIERILAFALALMLTMAGVAASAEILNVQNVCVNANKELSVLLYGPTDPDIKTFSATLDDRALAVNSLDFNSDGTTWMFLVDTSTVSVDKDREPIKALLGLGDNKGLIHGIGANDNAAVIATGDISENYALHTQITNLQSLATKLNKDTSNTMLNATIASALNFLNTNRGVKRHKVIVIVSGGRSDNESGMSLRELQDLVSASDVTVYTVTFVRKGSDLNAITQFNSLADNSCGGLQFTPSSSAKAEDAASIVKEIAANEARFSNLCLDPGGAPGAKLTVSLDNGNIHLEDSVQLSEEVQEALPHEDVEPTPSSEPELISEPTPEPKPSTPTLLGLPMTVVAAIAAAIVVILVLIIVLSVRARKKKEVERKKAEQKATTIPDEPPIPRKPIEPEIQVTLTQVGSDNEACYMAEMKNGELVAGRDPNQSKLVVQNDPHISRKHMTLRFSNGMMTVANESPNGTKVNGQKIDQPTTLHQQDVLTLGMTRLRITWWVKR